MLAFPTLISALSLVIGSYAAPLIVGTVTCEPYASGALDYSTHATAPLGGYRTTLNTQQELTVSVKDAACGTGIAPVFEFQTCNSTLMGYEQSPTLHYGHLKEIGTGQCVTLGSGNVLSLEDCYYSDDSGQVLQYFAFGSPSNAGLLTLVRGVYNGMNPLGWDLVPTAPPSPLADFTVTLTTPSGTPQNVLYLDSASTCH
ncbi:hypothetical protein DACRYDRAFT_22945 [Dacryopinax primogenitus]|uniref:Ricin B lectin domain-containing protein n=1 Tax=Dacryopinax primogenitus (strain DJM 731) TaxID=1858805 RepID=M5FXK2_DACPD|nr:uncharacterized protein DACRYDRAFT_22945 [Dacryopinax primogenitus]EJU01199.1 hypothetical protein DACRYDRAFT_22945 [Dacryopinax primogenitus]